MSLINNIKIPQKIALAFTVLVILVMGMGGVAIYQLGVLNSNTEIIAGNSLPSVRNLGLVRSDLAEIRRQELAIISRYSGSQEDIENAKKREKDIGAISDKVNHTLEIYSKLIGSPEEKALHDDFSGRWKGYGAVFAKVLDALHRGAYDEARTLQFGESSTYYANMLKPLDENIALNDRAASKAHEDAKRTYASSRMILIGAVVLVAILAILFALILRSAIAVPITRMTEVMGRLANNDNTVEVPSRGRRDEIGKMAEAVQVFKQNGIDKIRMEQDAEVARETRAREEEAQRKREAAIVVEVAAVAKAASDGDLDRRIDLQGKDGFLLDLCQGVNNLIHLTSVALTDVAGVLSAVADGDLTQRIDATYGGVFGMLKNDVNRTAEQLLEIVNSINNSASQIGSAASEVSAGSQDLSERSEEQASALEQTAASMEELASTVRQNAANAQQANQLAAGARTTASSGGQVVADAIVAMNRIESSSQKIEDIVGMIDEIAFQTNLLALNAAVEAARAGDAGKGFAVVAQEVRHLAQRSAQASKEIKTLIAESSTQVRSGAELVKGAGKTLDDILNGVRHVADIVAEIAAASNEQAAGIDQVNAAVTQMDEMTQQNAALVEESTAAAHALAEQSRELNRQMEFFQTGGHGKRSSGGGGGKPAPKPVAKVKPKPVVVKPAAKSKSSGDWAEF